MAGAAGAADLKSSAYYSNRCDTQTLPGQAVVFRRDRQQVTNADGLWDEARTVYAGFDADVNKSDLVYTFQPAGATVGFAGLQYEDDVNKWQGSQICLLSFDELTHFTEYQFFYMLSRNRSASVVRSYVRATTNPDADSWVAGFIAWWIDPETGFPIPERAGVLRWICKEQRSNFGLTVKRGGPVRGRGVSGIG